MSPTGPSPDRMLGWLALAAAAVVGLLLSVRVLTTEDLGYHLDYGRRLFETGRPVDHDAILYTLPDAATPRDNRPEPGPGCWYDNAGRYRFANASWLTQAFIAAAHGVAGTAGLNLTLIALVAALLALLAWLMHRLGVPPAASAVALAVLALAGYQRLTLRPELAGYVVLVAQACLLSGAGGAGGAGRAGRPLIPWPAVAGLIGLQLLFVNVHSYFVLGLALSGALLVGALAGKDVPREHLVRLGTLVAGQIVACFFNPWTWRLAIQPLQTVWLLQRHGIADGPGAHPWTSMAEMQRTALLDAGWTTNVAALALLACLGAIVAGAVAAFRARRWDRLLVMAGMTLVAFSARRNVAIGMMIAVPFALAALTQAPWWAAAKAWLTERPLRSRLASGAIVLGCAVLAWTIVTDRLYVCQDSPVRFGAGLSRLQLPIGAARWITDHGIRGRVWASPLCSSTILGFTEPRPQLNLVTNTWAYPPEVMRQVLAASSSYGPRPFEPAADRYDVRVVVTQSGEFLRQLVAERQWAPVHVEGRFVVLMRRDVLDRTLANRYEITPDDVDAGAMARATRALDPAPGVALWMTAQVLRDLGWYDEALALLAASRADEPREPRAWIGAANVLSRRAALQARTDPAAARADLAASLDALRRAWTLTADPALLAGIDDLERTLEMLNAHAVSAEKLEGARP